MTTYELKRWIENATYTDLLRKWRFAVAGDPFFVGEVGKYYQKVMYEKRKQVGDVGHTAASKAIGWQS